MNYIAARKVLSNTISSREMHLVIIQKENLFKKSERFSRFSMEFFCHFESVKCNINNEWNEKCALNTHDIINGIWEPIRFTFQRSRLKFCFRAPLLNIFCSITLSARVPNTSSTLVFFRSKVLVATFPCWVFGIFFFLLMDVFAATITFT